MEFEAPLKINPAKYKRPTPPIQTNQWNRFFTRIDNAAWQYDPRQQMLTPLTETPLQTPSDNPSNSL